MDNKDHFKDERGAGFEQIPEPDDSRLGREGFNGKTDDIVGGIMDNLEKAFTDDDSDDPDASSNQKSKDNKK